MAPSQAADVSPGVLIDSASILGVVLWPEKCRWTLEYQAAAALGVALMRHAFDFSMRVKKRKLQEKRHFTIFHANRCRNKRKQFDTSARDALVPHITV
jgi:hypothetical protein